MTSPNLFAIPGQVASGAATGNILRRSLIARDRDEWEAHMDMLSPARHLLRDDITVALEKYAYNRVGAIYFPYTHPEQRDHFLPHTGLWLHRPFDDPRVMTQIWMHMAFHEWFGWPLPVSTTYQLYTKACFVGEVLSTMESEYGLFDRFPEETAGMFNPAYPSTYEAFRAIGATTKEEATSLALHAQFNRGTYPDYVYKHPNFHNGVAITLHRQAAWASHDDVWADLNWKHQRVDLVTRLYHFLWQPERHRTIFERQAQGLDALRRYGAEHDYDNDEHLVSVAKSMLRTVALDSATASMKDADRIFSWVSRWWSTLQEQDAPFARGVIHFLADNYDDLRGTNDMGNPMPLWDLATEFRAFRNRWEADLKDRTAGWAEAQMLKGA